MRTFFRRGLVAALLLVGTFAASPAARADDTADAKQFISGLVDKAMALVGNKSLSDEARAQQFRDLFDASFDVPEIGRFVLGRHWKAATADQQQDFLKLFEDMTILTWSKRFKDYSGVAVQVQGVSALPGGTGQQVDTLIKRAQGDEIPLEWHVHRTEHGWRITDIVVQGVSMGLTQRQDFASAFQSSGGKVDAFLKTLHAKVDQLRAGT